MYDSAVDLCILNMFKVGLKVVICVTILFIHKLITLGILH